MKDQSYCIEKVTDGAKDFTASGFMYPDCNSSLALNLSFLMRTFAVSISCISLVMSTEKPLSHCSAAYKKNIKLRIL